MAMKVDNNVNIALVDKSILPDPDLPEDEDDDEVMELWQNLEDYCEPEEQYDPEQIPSFRFMLYPSLGLLYPICIGDYIHHPGGRYQIVHRLGKGGFSVVWLACDLIRHTSVALKIMVAGYYGEKEFAKQKMLKEAADLHKSGLNVYLDTFHLQSPFKRTREVGPHPSRLLHRVLVLPLAGPALSTDNMRVGRSLRARMTAAKSLLEALRDLHKAGFVHGDISLANVLWKINPSFTQEITNNPEQAFGAPPARLKFAEGQGLKCGHRVLPAEIPPEKLESQVVLADFGLLMRADETAVEYKLQGSPWFIAPERYHDIDPSQASDIWSFMIVFVHLYLGNHAFPDSTGCVTGGLHDIRAHLGPLPTAWANSRFGKDMYASSTEADLGDPPASKFAGRLREDWQNIEARCKHRAEKAAHGGKDDAATVKTLEQEYEAKREAEPHALEVIHSIFRYQPERRLTAEQLLVDPHWVELMRMCGVSDGGNGVQ